MKANELRIGNKFKMIGSSDSFVNTVFAIADNTERGKFNCDTPTHKEMYSHLITTNENGNQYKPWEIEGISITEEWLSKLGFTKIPDQTYINGNKFVMQVTGELNEDGSINRDGTWFDGIGDYSWLKADGLKTMSVNVLCRGNYVCNCAKYVHQLQNLYFVITGEELKITPCQ